MVDSIAEGLTLKAASIAPRLASLSLMALRTTVIKALMAARLATMSVDTALAGQLRSAPLETDLPVPSLPKTDLVVTFLRGIALVVTFPLEIIDLAETLDQETAPIVNASSLSDVSYLLPI